MSIASVPNNWLDNNDAPRALIQSIALEESHVPGILQTSIALIAGFLGVFLLWASLSPVEEVATTSGQIIPSGYIQNIQHLDGGIIKDIMVEDGQLVEKGQPLLKLDSTNAEADLGQMKSRQNTLRLQAERLRSFANGNLSDSKGHTMTVEEIEILKSMEESRSTQQNVLRDQISQREKELEGIRGTRAMLEKNVVLMKQEYDINRRMSARGSGSKIQEMTSERELNALRGQLSETMSQEKRAHDGINEARNRLQSLDAGLKEDAMKTLGQVEGELAETTKSIAKLENTSERTTINSPVRGLVKGLSIHTIGAVVEPGRVLMEIVPVEEELMVEALIMPADIGNLDKGQDVKVKVSAYDFARYGNIPGKIDTISASTFQSEDGQSFYKAKVKLEKNFVGPNSGKNQILPGMTVQADIVTGKKTVLEYLLKPIHQATQNAFQER